MSLSGLVSLVELINKLTSGDANRLAFYFFPDTFFVIAEGTVQLERAGVPGGLDRADSPRCANGSPVSPAGHYVSVN